MREGDERVCLHRVEPARAVRASVREGDRFGLDRGGASAKVLFAFGGAPGKAMDDIRRRLHAVSVGERDPETTAIASPVFGPRDALLGALNISGPRVRLNERRQRELKALLIAEAQALSLALGADKRIFASGSPPPEFILDRKDP